MKSKINRLDLLTWSYCINKDEENLKFNFMRPENETEGNYIVQAFIKKYGSIINLIDLICNEKSSLEPYGFASKTNFGASTRTVARLFAYDNKHFFVYKAISNPNKLGYLSRKQYYKCLLLKRKARKEGADFDVKKYLKENGTMASPYKLLKQAFKENQKATKFLSEWFPLQEDGKLKHEDTLLTITNSLLRLNLDEYKFVETSIDECYDLELGYSSFAASGPRHCSSSCMKHHKVGGFYNNLPVIGYMVKKGEENIGRFLYWTLPDGNHYVDRLYVKGAYAADVLRKIDEVFASDYRYGVTSPVDLNNYVIPFKSYDNMKVGGTFPYIDTFCYLLKKDENYFLSKKKEKPGYEFIDLIHTTDINNHDMGFATTTCCNKRFWKKEYNVYNAKTHKLYCEKYVPRAKKDRELLALFRKLKGVQYA